MEQQTQEPKFFKTIFEDLGKFLSDLFSGEFFRQFKKGVKELREYFLDKHRENRLESMGRMRRSLYLIAWLFKSLIFRLSSYRRVLIILALYFIFSANNDPGNYASGRLVLGTLIFLFIILLELKDKLLARDELEAGRSIQEALVPETSPRIPGWDIWLFTRPANDVGGDLLDFIKIEDKRYGIAIGDVAGKGLPAALLMAKLQSTLRALAPDYSSLTELVSKINLIFYRDSLPNRFASLLYIQLETGSNTLRYVNAGHFPPFRIKDGDIAELDKGAPAIGIMPNIDLSERSISLERNELFLVYSDGLTEARNESGEFFGEERLAELLSDLKGLNAEKAGQKILNAVDTYMGTAPANDDLSMMMLRYTG